MKTFTSELCVQSFRLCAIAQSLHRNAEKIGKEDLRSFGKHLNAFADLIEAGEMALTNELIKEAETALASLPPKPALPTK